MHTDQIAAVMAGLERRLVAACRGGKPEGHVGPAAVDVLTEYREIFAVRPAQILGWAISAALPPQRWENNFGDPALTVIANDVFRVDLRFWTLAATPTHKHVSCGAFAALHGDRLHQSWNFCAEEALGQYLTVGKLSRQQAEVMRVGEVREIQPEVIHDLFWLSRPSVTLSVRCNQHPGARHMPWEYHEPGLGVLDMCHHESALVSRRVAALRLLRRVGAAGYLPALRQACSAGDPVLAYHAAADATVSGLPGAGEAAVDALDTRGDGLGPVLTETLITIGRRTAVAADEASDERLTDALRWAALSPTELTHLEPRPPAWQAGASAIASGRQ
jgi:hypothetical protein